MMNETTMPSTKPMKPSPKKAGKVSRPGITIALHLAPAKAVIMPPTVPPIIAVYIYSKLEKALKKVVPDAAYQFIMPCISLVIMVPLCLIVIGPTFNYLGELLSAGYAAIYEISPLIPGIVLGGFWQLLVIFGMHAAFIPLIIQNVVTMGYDTMSPIIGPSNFSIPGATLGVLLKTKNKSLKNVAASATVSGILGGITEPVIYGVCLPVQNMLQFLGNITRIVRGLISIIISRRISLFLARWASRR